MTKKPNQARQALRYGRYCLTLIVLAATSAANAAGKTAKDAVTSYCPAGMTVLEGKSVELAGIRKTALVFVKLDFEWSRQSPSEWKYEKLVPGSELRLHRSIFSHELDVASIRGYCWSHACLGAQGATAWVKIDLAYICVSTSIAVYRDDEIRTEQRYLDPASGTQIDALDGASLLYRVLGKRGEYEDYLQAPQRYYLLPLQLVKSDEAWLVSKPRGIRNHIRIDTPGQQRHRKELMSPQSSACKNNHNYCWNEHDEAILQLINKLTKPAFKD